MNGEYTIKEIEKIPVLLEKAKEYEIKYDKNKSYTFVGCGSSYNLGLISSRILKKYDYTTQIISGGEIITFDYFQKTDYAIFISRTGESTETVKAIDNFKKRNIRTIGITCTPNSSLTKKCDENYIFDFANEQSVVMTGSFVFILNFLLNGIKYNDYSEESKKIINDVEKLINSIELKKYNHYVFLGFNEQYGISKEGALKIEEMAIQNVEFHEPLEYRHGPKSLLNKNTLIIINSKDTKEEYILAKELANVGAKVILLGENGDINIKYNDGFESVLKMILPLYLGYNKSIIEGYNPDRPKNLSKSVILDQE